MKSISAPTIYINHAFLAYHNDILFDDLNLVLTAGKCTCLLGPSGVGKTTLLRMIANLVPNETEFRGEIRCDNPDPLDKQISYMAQTDLLLPWLTTLENALLQFRLQGKKSQHIQRAKDLLVRVGLKDAMHKYPRELSGGMRQRVALVRTLLQDKPVVLMDEPFSAVDTITRFQLQTLATELLKDKTVLLVTHDPLEALRIADKIYILSGQPATLTSPFELVTSTPRDLADPELIQHQAQLFHALLQAKEVS